MADVKHIQRSALVQNGIGTAADFPFAISDHTTEPSTEGSRHFRKISPAIVLIGVIAFVIGALWIISFDGRYREVHRYGDAKDWI